MQTDGRILIGKRGITDRVGRWGACEKVGRRGPLAAEVAADVGCDWRMVNRSVIAYGSALVDDPPTASGRHHALADETVFV